MDSDNTTKTYLHRSPAQMQPAEEACRKFEEALRRGELPGLEPILCQADPSDRGWLLRELLTREMEFRAANGEAPSSEEFRERFPNDLPLVKYLYYDHFVPARVGEFTIQRLVGRGGFGFVYQAWDPRLSRNVAIKVFGRDPDEQGQGSNLLVEARSAAQLRHPGIVTVHAVLADADGDEFLVLEYVDGRSLEDVLGTERYSPLRATELMLAVARALQHAHRHGLVHRDLKPGNILIDQRGQPRVTDFGLALHVGGLQRSREIAGTFPYMAPEQANGETHRLDARTDLWSLGVVFYRLLSSRLPFSGGTRQELLEAIRYKEPEDLSTIAPDVPVELVRIVRRCLAKRISQRYSSAAELAHDLRAFLRDSESGRRDREVTPAAGTGAVAVVPKGLRCFDSGDSEFFLHLVPGPRDRHGVPQGVRFWQRHLQELDSHQTFRVGLLYGPSGCGKSSLVRAGILPRLTANVMTVVADVTREKTEVALAKELSRRFQGLSSDAGLPEILTQLREGSWLAPGEKLMLVFDQFEQWLHGWRHDDVAPLLEALRQCDGGRIQALVLVRDDFWMPATRFFHELDVQLVEGFNSSAVDLFDRTHAGKVLAAFGVAYGKLPAEPTAVSSEQKRFLDSAVTDLAVDGWIVPVRLCIFAEMVKSRPWTPETLREVGGAQGLGSSFLEEVFAGRMAAPAHRVHHKAAQAVLERLLPPVGSDIRGHLVSESELQKVADYENRPADFAALLRCLDQDLRLITPSECGEADPEGDMQQAPGQYQLTHDYLVTAIRAWLNQARRRTLRGRAEIRLTEYATAYAARPEARQLPSWWEWSSLLLLTRWRDQKEPQRVMMRAATRRYAVRSGLIVIAAALVGAVLYDRMAAIRADGLVQALVTSDSRDVSGAVARLSEFQRWARPRLARHLDAAGTDGNQRIRLLAGSLAVGSPRHEELGELMLEAEPPLVVAIADLMVRYGGLEQLEPRLRQVAADPLVARPRRLRACVALARVGGTAQTEIWGPIAGDVAKLMLREIVENPRYFEVWVEGLAPVRHRLVEPLGRLFVDPSLELPEQVFAAEILARFAADDSGQLLELALQATPRQFEVISKKLVSHADAVRDDLAREIQTTAPNESEEQVRDQIARRQANALLLLSRLGDDRQLWTSLRHQPDPRLRSFVLRHLNGFPGEARPWAERLANESDPGIRQALILVLGSAPSGSPAANQAELQADLLRIYRDDVDPGVHGAAQWALHRLGCKEPLAQAQTELARLGMRDGYHWYVTPSGITMILIGPVGEVELGSPPSEPDRDKSDETVWTCDVNWRFAISATEITQAQFIDVCPDYPFPLNENAPEADCPVNAVMWSDAIEFCKLLNRRDGLLETDLALAAINHPRPRPDAALLSKRGYRLPTEVEWEVACRAGTTTPRFFGYDPDFTSAIRLL